MRAVLPNRRRNETFEFRLEGVVFTATVGYADDDKIAELFLNSRKLGSAVDSVARDSAIAVSIALQHGVAISTLRHAMTRNEDGSASSPIGKLLDLLECD